MSDKSKPLEQITLSAATKDAATKCLIVLAALPLQESFQVLIGIMAARINAVSASDDSAMINLDAMCTRLTATVVAGRRGDLKKATMPAHALHEGRLQ